MELMPKTTFKWGGCSHNIRYGIRFSKWFLDSREKGADIQSKITLHNNQVGRKVSKYFYCKIICLLFQTYLTDLHILWKLETWK